MNAERGICHPLRGLWHFFRLCTHSLTRVFDVPATKLEVSVTGLGKTGAANVEVLIYGQF